jgi:ABC-2 type transport system ATP-binding protein
MADGSSPADAAGSAGTADPRGTADPSEMAGPAEAGPTGAASSAGAAGPAGAGPAGTASSTGEAGPTGTANSAGAAGPAGESPVAGGPQGMTAPVPYLPTSPEEAATQPGPGVVARGVRRTFGGVVAIDRMDLDAPAGQVTALVGPNGSGKTTLLLILATLLAPDFGEVTVAGFDPVTAPRQVRARTGWMPDAFGTWESLTCREALTTTADAHRVPRSRSRQRIADLLDLVHLSDLADRPTQVLSRGQKQRLGLARALVHGPSVLLLDEPASGLDPLSRMELRGLVRGLAADGAAVLVSSHVLAELDEMADRAVVVDRGRTVAVESVTAPTHTERTWRLRALDGPSLLTALDARGLAHSAPGRDGVDVLLPSEEAAADLFTGLVRDGVRLVSCHPASGILEEAYRALTQERR